LWRATEGLGQEGQRLALTLAQQEGELRRKKKALDMANTLSEVDVYVEDAAESLSIKLRREPDPDTHFANFEVGFAKIVNDSLKDIRNAETLAKAKILTNRIYTRRLIREKDYANKLWVEVGQAKVERTLDGYARQGNLEAGLQLMEEATVGGLYAANAAERVKQAFRDAVNISKVRAGINVDPSEENVNRLLKEFSIPPEKEVFFRERAERLRDSRRREEEREEINTVYAKLRADWGDNYEAALKTLADPKYQKNVGITGNQAHDIGILLKSEWAIQEARNKKVYEDTSLRLYNDVIFNEELSQKQKITQIDEAVRDKMLNWQLGEHFRTAVANPPSVVTDPAEYNSILRDITMGADKDLLNARILASRKLSNEDKMELGRRLFTKATGTTDEWIKKSESYLRSQVVPKRGMLEKIVSTPREERDYYMAVKALRATLAEARAVGRPIEGSAILDAAIKITPLYQRPLAERLATVYVTYEKEGVEVAKIMKVLKKGKKYKTVDEVMAALRKKPPEITEEEARIILRHTFKMEER